jgi:hypothetical protein
MVRKKNLSVNRFIYSKIDEAFQNLIFIHGADLRTSGLEIIVTDSVNLPVHIIYTRALYAKNGKKSVAFRDVKDEIRWNYVDSLAEDYAKRISHDIDYNIYISRVQGNRISIQSRATKDQIEKDIAQYVVMKGGRLSKGEFMDLTGATEAQLVECFGKEHDTLTRRAYSACDITRFSREYFKRTVRQSIRGHQVPQTVYKRGANIMNIYRKVLKEIQPYRAKPGEQGMLFG